MRKRLLSVALSTCAFILVFGSWRDVRAEEPGPKVVPARRFGVSSPLRDLAGRPEIVRARAGARDESTSDRLADAFVSSSGTPDRALHSPRAAASRDLDAPSTSFEGPSLSDTLGLSPFDVLIFPDPVVAVGPNRVVAVTNFTYVVYDKTGSALTAPVLIRNIFADALSGTGEPDGCEFTNHGHPNLLYDHLADRWVISQSSEEKGPPFLQCIAVSQTSDPTGAFYVYEFEDPNGFATYLQYMGLWPDGYYMSVVEDVRGDIDTAAAHAFERDKMLRGEPDARDVYFTIGNPGGPSGNSYGGLPSTLSGPPPPAGTPNVYAFMDADEFSGSDSIVLFDFSVDWSNPANSTFTPRSTVAVAAFDATSPSGSRDIPQPLPADSSDYNLEAHQERLLYPLQFRDFGTYTSLVTAHAVDAEPTAAYRAGVRYYELRDTGTGYTVHEQATYAPLTDTANRWMPSAALDAGGNLAVGYNVAGLSVYPSIRYAGRLAGDAAGGLTQAEQTLIDGTAIQSHTNGRWGEHGSIVVDPADDCTFWLIDEYYTEADSPGASDPSVVITRDCPNYGGPFEACWHTRIGSFTFSGTGYSCSAAATGVLSGTVQDSVTSAPIAGATVNAGGYAAVTDGSGDYSLPSVVPGTYSVTASKLGYSDATQGGVVVTASSTTDQDLFMVGIPIVAIQSVTLDDSAGNNNGEIDANECFSLSITLVNSGAAAYTGVSGTLSTATAEVSFDNAVSAYPDVTASGGTAVNTLTFDLSTSAAFPAGTSPIDLTLDLTADQGATQLATPVATHIGTLGTPSRVDNTTPLPIPDFPLGPALSPVVISGLTGVIGKVEVELHVTHTDTADLLVELVGPDDTSTILVLADRIFGSSGMGLDCADQDTVFSDEAATSIEFGDSPWVGAYRPWEPLSTFDGLSGAAMNGTWNLRVRDSFTGDVGTIECWALTITPATPTPGSGACGSSSPNIFLDGFESGDTSQWSVAVP